MKSIKKALIGLGVAGALATTSMPASAVMQMLFYNSGFTLLGVVEALPTVTSISFGGTFEGWKVTGSIGTSDNPSIGLSISGTAQRLCDTVTSTCARNISQTPFVNPFAGVIGGTAATLTYAANLGFAVDSNLNNDILRIRVLDSAFPITPAGTVLNPQVVYLQNSLTSTRSSTGIFPATGVQKGKYSAEVDTVTPITVFNFGGLPFVVDPANPFSKSFQTTTDSGSIGIQAGIDLYPDVIGSTVQAATDFFQFTYALTGTASEPGSLALLGLSLVGLAAYRRKKLA